MNLSIPRPNADKGISLLAQSGLIAKGFVYVILGVLAFMAAFELGQGSSANADRTGVLHFLNNSIAGKWLLPLLATGLICYSIWRFIEAYRAMKEEGKWKKGLRYLLSGIVYLFISFSAIKVILHKREKNGDSEQALASELLSKPFGQWLLAIAALIIACIGIYQVYYALSEKYRQHIEKLNFHSKQSSAILAAGKTGYISRGIVWLIIAYFMIRAAIAASSSEAGDTGKVFEFLKGSPMGPYLTAVLAVGLMAYGFFNFVRAKYERL